MTDQRERARALAREICSGLSVENLSDGGMNILTQHIETALADAERRVWDEAAKGLENHVVYAPSDEAYDNEVGKDGDGTSYNQGVRAAIAWIRSQATKKEG